MDKKVYNRAPEIGSIAFVLLLVSCLGVSKAPHQTSLPTAASEQPEKVTVCQLKANPPKYDHKVIEVTGFLSHGFEDSSLFDPHCPEWPVVWMEYGGTAASGTMYCCGVIAERTRPKQMVVEDIQIPLLDDTYFQAFDKLLHRRPDSVVHASLVGRFFSGKRNEAFGPTSWSGYGHMGCCSLFVIQQVLSVDPHDRDDLDYGASADQPNSDKVGCGYRDLLALEPYRDAIEAQHKAEAGQRVWAFDDPQRVAIDSLVQAAKLEEGSIKLMKRIRTVPGRIVYEWKPAKQRATYMVVVSRPYWLSFSAHDPKKVAWVAIAAYKAGCGADNSVTRIK